MGRQNLSVIKLRRMREAEHWHSLGMCSCSCCVQLCAGAPVLCDGVC